jgi:hypothetical protein
MQAVMRERKDPPTRMADRVRWLLTRKSRAYTTVFDGTEGRVVLRDLYELIRPSIATPMNAPDGSMQALKMAESEGRRAVWQHIMTRLRLQPDTIETLANRFDEPEGDTW